MNVKVFGKHVIAMERIEAMEHLRDLRAHQFANMKEDAQSKYHNEIRKKAFPIQKVYSFDEIESALGIK